MLDEGGRLYGWRGWSGGAFQRQSGFGLPQQSTPVFLDILESFVTTLVSRSLGRLSD